MKREGNIKMIKIKRIYEPFDKKDGYRILVDRLWPRGMSKDKARVDLWLKNIAPSNELRKWYSHDPEKWPEFQKRYFGELADSGEEFDKIRDKAEAGDITLLYSSKEQERNNAVALLKILKKRLPEVFQDDNS
jgi:uncharacterized protein YeaO (DUF488 family)